MSYVGARPIKAVMITMKGREESAKATAKQFAKLGIPVKKFVQPLNKPVGADSNRWNSRRALAECLEDGSHALFIEDDLEVNPGRLLRAVQEWHKMQEASPSVMYLYLTEDEARVGSWYVGSDLELTRRGCVWKNMRRTGDEWKSLCAGKTIQEAPRLLKSKQHLFGTQAVLIPHGLLRALIDDYIDHTHDYGGGVTSRNTRPFDGTLLWFVQNHSVNGQPLRVYSYLPHPIQHLQVRLRRSSGRILANSASYHFTSDLDGWEPDLESVAPLFNRAREEAAAGGGEQDGVVRDAEPPVGDSGQPAPSDSPQRASEHPL